MRSEALSANQQLQFSKNHSSSYFVVYNLIKERYEAVSFLKSRLFYTYNFATYSIALRLRYVLQYLSTTNVFLCCFSHISKKNVYKIL